MKYVAVISNTGVKLMPTTVGHARKLLKRGRAKIYKHKPVFVIQLLDRDSGVTQPIEYKCDTGCQHIGISICSEKHEYVSQQRDLLKDETEKHNDKRKYRRTRRNRKTRYRAPRFDNRTHGHNKPDTKGERLAPSIQNKLNQHILLFNAFKAVMPITKAVFEMGQFDTQLLKAIENGDPIPVGKDYQQGERYQIATLREAVFGRDNYTCKICGRTIKDGAILHTHHIGYWKEDRTNRISNLLTVCEKCHTSKNHAKGGELYGLEPKLPTLKGATFMSTVKWYMYNILKGENPDVEVSITYGAMTKCKRHELHIDKSHANDAYAMGTLHPKHRTKTTYWEKQRRNNRILEKFYDAKYIDHRDQKVKSGKELTNGRISRNHKKDSENERIYRERKVSKGKRTVRTVRHALRPNDTVLYGNKKYKIRGVHCNGTRAILKELEKSVAISKLECVEHCNGWVQIN